MNDYDADGAFTISAFGEWADVGRTFTYDEINSGRLKAVKAGNKTLIIKSDARAWLNSLPALGSRASNTGHQPIEKGEAEPQSMDLKRSQSRGSAKGSTTWRASLHSSKKAPSTVFQSPSTPEGA